MNVFFGKISTTNNPEQFKQGYYKTEQPSNFNGIDVGDYCFAISGKKIGLWKAKNWLEQDKELKFDILIPEIGIDTKDLNSFIYFKVTKYLTIYSVRQAKNKAFFKIDNINDLNEAILLDINSYKTESNYRKLIVHENFNAVENSSKDLQVYFEKNELKIFINSIIQDDLFDNFRDNRIQIGGNRKRKDSVLVKFNNLNSFPKIFTRNEISIQNLYDAFAVDYKTKIEDIIPENGSITFKEIVDDFFENIISDTSIFINFTRGKEDFTSKKKFVWLKDHLLEIGDSDAHYELYNEGNIIYVDIHFENKSEAINMKYKEIIGNNLPSEIKWHSWGSEGSESLRYKEAILLNDADAVENIKEALFYFENNISDKIRGIKKGKIEYLNNSKMKQPLNQILYGPPGTGKTYNSINKALMIIEDLTEKELITKYPIREDAKTAFDKYIERKQIAFTTFHQSMSYEDFIEGIKPLKPNEGEQFLKYDVLPGIFKEMCDNAKYIEANVSTIDWNNRRFFKMSIGGKNRPDVHEWCLQNNKIAFGYGGEKDLSSFTTRDGWEKFRDKFNADLPDVVKETSYNTTASYAFLDMKIGDIVFISKGNFLIDAIGIISGEYEYNPNVPEVEYVHFRSIDWVVKDMNISVERFLKKNFSQQTIYYLNKNDVKIDALESLTSDKKDSNVKPYVLIIDEINRGNVSQIFGELITLIEEDKRQGKAEALKVMLPYSKKEFSVPPNLYVVGTMNTADRSVEALDTALRRRFTFEEIPPNEDLDLIQYDVFDTTASAILKTLNTRIEKLLDKDHKLGHSFFIKKDSDSAEEKIVETFYKNIIPLLQEYFFGDFGKIGLVLGKRFVTVDNSNVPIFADFDYESKEDYQVKEIYSIRDFRIGNDMNGFKDAIKLLMANK
jgi:hypothetical protein